DSTCRHVGYLAREAMRELGQPRVVAKQHHALHLVANLMDHVEQVARPDCVQPLILDDFVPVAELFGNDLCRPKCAHGGTRQDQIWLHVALRQSLTHLRCVAPTAIVQWPVFVGQCGVGPTGLGVANEKERFHVTSRTGGRCRRRWSALAEAAASNRRDQARRTGNCSEYRAFSECPENGRRPDVAQTTRRRYRALPRANVATAPRNGCLTPQ